MELEMARFATERTEINQISRSKWKQITIEHSAHRKESRPYQKPFQNRKAVATRAHPRTTCMSNFDKHLKSPLK